MKNFYSIFRIISLLCLLLLVNIPHMSLANENLKATPYRPTVSNPAELSEPGYLEIEAGLSQIRDEDIRNNYFQYLSKFSFNENWGILIGGNGWGREEEDEHVIKGAGDTFVLAKHMFEVDLESQALGLEFGLNLPTSKNGLGNDQTDLIINGIHSIDLNDSWRVDTNFGITRLGNAEYEQGRNKLLLVSCLGYTSGKWGVALELAGTYQSNVKNLKQLLLSTSYSISPRLVIDAAFIHMKQEKDKENTMMFGLTWLVGEIF